jgi:hypothetical protein
MPLPALLPLLWLLALPAPATPSGPGTLAAPGDRDDRARVGDEHPAEAMDHVGHQDPADVMDHAGHEHPANGMDHGNPPETMDHAGHEHAANGMDHGAGPAMGILGSPMAREASGTSWQPDTTPVFGWHFATGGFRWMVHGLAFASWDTQSTRRGDAAFVSTNWAMVMARHDLAGGELDGRLMLSAEPATVGTRGYPLLLQSGESVGGKPLVDRQHPHDLFMELALLWTRPLGDDLAIQLYVAPSGEPALGPTAFPHRAAAFADPLAPLGHHWQDATHITFGVLTGGVFTRYAKLEASWFAGREPDEHRWGLDLRPLDSWSARLTANPWRWASAQASVGYLRSPEALAPELDLWRLTASVQTVNPLGETDYLATTWALGRNAPVRHHPPTDAALVEGLVALGPWNLFTRLEWAEKTGHDLGLAALEDTVLELPSVSLGVVRDLGAVGPLVPGLGIQAAVDPLPDALEAVYGARAGYGGMVFLRLRPPRLPAHAP